MEVYHHSHSASGETHTSDCTNQSYIIKFSESCHAGVRGISETSVVEQLKSMRCPDYEFLIPRLDMTRLRVVGI